MSQGVGEGPDRVCLLTGAGGTLGRAFCERNRQRFSIAAVYRNRPPASPNQLTRTIDPLGTPVGGNHGELFAIRSDLTEPGELHRVVELTVARFGHVDLLVNAAVHSIWSALIGSDLALRSADEQFQVNALLPLRLTVEVVMQHWRDRADENRARNRNVVNLSSTAGLYIYPGQGQSVYSASKAALNNLTCHMADELGVIGVRANVLAPNSFPGIVPTEAVADAIVRLDKGHASGSILVLDHTGEQVL